MFYKKSKSSVFTALALAIGTAIMRQTSASDHTDSPITTHDGGADVDDHRSFFDPNDNSKVVMMSTDGILKNKDSETEFSVI